MDAEKFDKVVLDLLYDELDELTRASAIRHTEQSGRAKALYTELRATREVGVLPLVEPPSDLEARILEAEKLARAARPLRQRVGSIVSIVASYTMRPQLGMAAVLMLMVGSSLLLLRVKPGAPSAVQVTERGVPESDKEIVAVPVPPPTPVAPGAVADEPAPERQALRREAPKGEATEEKAAAAPTHAAAPSVARAEPANPAAYDALDEGAASGHGSAAFAPVPADRAAGATAGGADDERSDKSGAAGCAATLPHYEALMANPPSQAAGNAARLAAADCYARLGRLDSARRQYTALLSTPYGDRARAALAQLPSANAAPPASPPAAEAARAKAATEAPAAAAPQAKPSEP